MEAVIEAIDAELRAVSTALETLKAEHAQREAALNAQRETLKRARELVLPLASGEVRAQPPQRERTAQRRGADAEAIEHLYPSNGDRTTRVGPESSQ
jgi:hypothetical protein